MGSSIDCIVDLVLGRKRTYPKVLCCDVPNRHSNVWEKKNGDDNEQYYSWWKVYEDEFIFVHARSTSIEKINEEQYSYSKRHVEDTKHEDRDEINIDIDENIDDIDDSEGNAITEDHLGGVVYIITLKVADHSYSFAVLPPKMDSYTSSQILQPLPEDIMMLKSSGVVDAKTKSSSNKEANILDFILHLDPANDTIINDKDGSFVKVHPHVKKLTKNHLVTRPDNNQLDLGLLIRATHQAKLLHSRLPFAFPQSSIFTNNREDKRSQNEEEEEQMNVSYVRALKSMHHVPYKKLPSCSTVLLDIAKNRKSHFNFICRREDIYKKIRQPILQKSTVKPKLQEVKNLYSQLQQQPSQLQNNQIGEREDKDANEIDLSEESEDDETPPSDATATMVQPPQKRIKTHGGNLDGGGQSNINETNAASILVLGTGCASPSPLRGSSGYALLLPTMIKQNNAGQLKNSLVLSAIIECGEGSLLTMIRHLQIMKPPPMLTNNHPKTLDMSFLFSIRLIWISHAHLDHYSELPLLLHTMHTNRRGQFVCACYENPHGRAKQQSDYRSTLEPSTLENVPKCKRCGQYLPPVLIAPPKVLKFVDISLNCSNGICRNRGDRFFFSIANRDFDSSPFSSQIREDLWTFSLRRPLNTDRKIAGQYTLPTYEYYNPFASLKSVPVEHCPNAYALILGLRLPNPPCMQNKTNLHSLFQLCYSGDTRPSSNIIRACEALLSYRNDVAGKRQSISLLIHEATFDDDERGKKEAIRKRHSTVQEAIRIAAQINADVCLLTHFSQRYPKLPPGHNVSVNEAAVTIASNEEFQSTRASSRCVGSAFDAMLIPLDNSVLGQLLPVLSAEIFAVLDEPLQHD